MDGNGVDNIDRNLQVWMTSNGGETYDVSKMRYTLDDPKTIEAYEFLVKLAQRPSGDGHARAVGPWPSRPLQRALHQRDHRLPPGVHRAPVHLRPEHRHAVRVGRGPFPSGTKAQPFIGHSDADVTQVYAKGKNVDEAYDAAKFIGGDVMQKIMAENKLLIPALRKAAEDQATFLKAPPRTCPPSSSPSRRGSSAPRSTTGTGCRP